MTADLRDFKRVLGRCGKIAMSFVSASFQVLPLSNRSRAGKALLA
jgi:hypothetical protein